MIFTKILMEIIFIIIILKNLDLEKNILNHKIIVINQKINKKSILIPLIKNTTKRKSDRRLYFLIKLEENQEFLNSKIKI